MTVSVLIPSKNPGVHLAAAVRSAKAQIETSQILVADAGSTDDSSRAAELLGVTVIDVGDIGQVAARNELVKHATGEWVQWLDADDYLLPGKFTAQIAAADQADAVYCDVQVLQTRVGNRRIVRRLAGISPLAAVTSGTAIAIHAYLTRLELAQAVPFDPAFEAGGCVSKWAIDLTSAGARFAHVPIVGCVYRDAWSDNQTTANKEATAAGFQRIRRVLAEGGPPSLGELLAPLLPNTEALEPK